LSLSLERAATGATSGAGGGMTLKIFCPNADRDHSKEVGDVIADLGHHALSLSARSPGPMCLKTGGPIGLQGGTGGKFKNGVISSQRLRQA
jgi:hypothetical protein